MDFFVNADEETLDPQDWEAMRSLGHRMVDDMLTWLETVRERKVWQPVPAEVKAHLQQPLPLEGEPPEAIYEDFRTNILPYPMGNVHPRFWSWVMGNGTALGMLAEMLAAGFNPNMGGGEHVGHLRRAAGARLDEADARLSPGGERPVGERRVDGEPGGPRGRAQCAGRLRCAP